MVASRCWSFGTDHVFIRILNDFFCFHSSFCMTLNSLDSRPLKKPADQHLRPLFQQPQPVQMVGSQVHLRTSGTR